jgi:hypothetical protein
MLDTFYLASFTGRTNEKFEIFCKIKLFSKQFHPYKNKYYRKTLFGDIKRLTSSELHCIYITILLLKTQTIIFIKNILQTSILILIKSRKQEPYSGRNVWVGAVGGAEEGETLQERSVVIGGEAKHVENHLRSTVQ